MFDAFNQKSLQHKPLLPFGVMTLALVSAALLAQWLLQGSNACEQLRAQLDQQGGYFLRWQAPELMLLTKGKQQRHVQADDEQSACTAMLNNLKGE